MMPLMERSRAINGNECKSNVSSPLFFFGGLEVRCLSGFSSPARKISCWSLCNTAYTPVACGPDTNVKIGLPALLGTTVAFAVYVTSGAFPCSHLSVAAPMQSRRRRKQQRVDMCSSHARGCPTGPLQLTGNKVIQENAHNAMSKVIYFAGRQWCSQHQCDIGIRVRHWFMLHSIYK